MSASTLDILSEILHLRHLLPDIVFLWEADHKDNCDFHEEVDYREENNEVVQALLPVLHLVGVPVGNPVNHPDEIYEPGDDKQNQELHFIIILILQRDK